jgi:hypothetical protein
MDKSNKIPIAREVECVNFWTACYARHPTLQHYPLLAVLLMRGCMEQQMASEQLATLSAAQDVATLLQSIDLEATPELCALLNHVRGVEAVEPISIHSTGLAALYQEVAAQRLTTLPQKCVPRNLSALVGLACLLADFPALYQGRMIRRLPLSASSIFELRSTLKLAANDARRLGYADNHGWIRRCRTVKAFDAWGKRLSHTLDRAILQRLQGTDLDSADAVLAQIGDLLSGYQRRQLKQYWHYPATPAAFADTAHIQQLSDFRALFLEAHQQQHCGLTYWHEVRDGTAALFRVMAPHRATLLLTRESVEQPFQFDELVGRNNQRVSAKAWKVVRAWFYAQQPKPITSVINATA